MQTSAFHRPILASIALAAALATSPAQTAPRPTYDGAWTVLIITDSGTCDRAYRYGLRIQQGQVVYDGGGEGAPVQITGRVDPRGRIEVSLRSGDREAVGTGQLSGDSGTGRWQGASPSNQCEGRWEAERRG
jgi:hypothetical protein